jgi:hypothetical protein
MNPRLGKEHALANNLMGFFSWMSCLHSTLDQLLHFESGNQVKNQALLSSYEIALPEVEQCLRITKDIVIDLTNAKADFTIASQAQTNVFSLKNGERAVPKLRYAVSKIEKFVKKIDANLLPHRQLLSINSDNLNLPDPFWVLLSGSKKYLKDFSEGIEKSQNLSVLSIALRAHPLSSIMIG